MKQTETAQFLAVVKTAYPNFEITKPVVQLWHEYLMDIPFDQAKKNLQEHIRSNRFPPTISEIVRHDPNHFTNHEQLQLEAEERFRLLDEWEQLATDPPKELEMRWKSSE